MSSSLRSQSGAARATARRHARRGSAAIEFGFWFPILMAFLSAVIDYGMYMNQRVDVARAVMEGCRSGASVFEKNDVAAGSIMIPTAITRTNQVLADLGIACPSAQCTSAGQYCALGAKGDCAAPPFDALYIEVTFQFTPPIGLLPVPVNIRERFIMAAENQRTLRAAAGG